MERQGPEELEPSLIDAVLQWSGVQDVTVEKEHNRPFEQINPEPNNLPL